MSLSFWIDSLRVRLGRQPAHLRKPPRRPLTRRLTLERLEDRTLLSAATNLPSSAVTAPSAGNNQPALASTAAAPAVHAAVQISNISVMPSAFQFGGNSSTTLSYSLSAAAKVTVNVLNSSGLPVVTLLMLQSQTSGTHSLSWNGKNTSGTAVADGNYTFSITATPLTGPGTPTTQTAKVTVTPALTISTYTHPINIADQSSLAASGTTETGDTVTVQLSDSSSKKSASYSAVVDSHGNWLVSGINASALADGNITYTVTATDGLGISTVETVQAAKGTVAPALTITTYTNPINIAANNLVSLSGQTGSGDSVSVQVSDGKHSVSGQTTANSSGSWSISGLNVSTLADGPITYTVTATDVDGNTTTKSLKAVKDTVAPTVAINTVSASVNLANQTNTSASGTSGAGDTVALYVVDSTSKQTKTYTTTASGSGSWSIGGIDVSGLADGTLTYTATATDAYGNVSSAATKTTNKNTVAALLTISSVTNPINIASNGLASASGTADAGDSVTLQISDGQGGHTSVFSTTASGSGAWSFSNENVSGLADGTITYTVTADNAAGNPTTKTATALKLTVAPALSISNAPNIDLANQTNVSVSGTTAVGAAVTVQVSDKNSKSISANAVVDSHGNWSVSGLNLSTLADGAITYTVTATDVAGNSTVQTANAVKDTVAPTLTITSYTNPVNIAANNHVSASGRTGANDAITVQVSDGTNSVSASTTANSSGVWSVSGVNVQTLLDGPITYTVTATDAAGNSTSKSVDAVKDTVAPAVAITSVPASVNLANQTSTTASGTTGAGDSVSLYVVDGGGTQTKTYTTTASASGNWSISGIDVSGLADGTLTYTATATDAYGNVSSTAATTTTKNTVAALLTISSVTNPVNIASNDIASASGKADAGDSVTLQISDGQGGHTSVFTTTADGNGDWSVMNVDAHGLADGTITYTVTADNAAGNPTTKTATALKLTVAPALSISNAPNIDLANQSNVSVSGTTAVGAAVTVQVSDKNNKSISANAVVDSHGNWSVSGLDLSGLADGAITYTVTATDAAGNSTIQMADAVKDTVAPTLTISNYINPINIASNNLVSASGRTGIGDSVTVQVSDGTNSVSANATVDGSGNWSVSGISVSTLADGPITYTVTATDAAGNSTSKSVDATKDTVAPPLTITSAPDVHFINNGLTSAAGTTGAGDFVAVLVTDQNGKQSKTYTTTADGGGNWSITGIDVSQLADGSITYTATATDAASNATTRTAGATKNTTDIITTAASNDSLPSVQLNDPFGEAVDAAGDLFIAEPVQNVVLRVDAKSGMVTTVAGNGIAGYNGDGEAATSAELSAPEDVAVDAAGDLFIAEANNNRIREVNASTGMISTVAGNGTAGFSGDGAAATSAELNGPFGVAVDAAGDLFIADTNNERIREVNTSGMISTVAGNGTAGFSGDGSPATSAELNTPLSVAVDAAGDLFIDDRDNNRIREVNTSDIISTVAGNGTRGFSGGGAATSAELDNVFGIAVDAAGDLFIADRDNNRIREVNTSGMIFTVAGNGTAGFSGDGSPATSAELASPQGIALDAAGDLFIADTGNEVIRRVDATTGILTTFAGQGADYFNFGNPQGVAVDAAGDLFIADTFNNRIRELNASTGIITTIAGTGAQGFSGDNGLAVNAQLNSPTGIAVDAAGDLVYFIDSGNDRIRQVNLKTRYITTIAGTGTFGYNGDGEAATSAELNDPLGIALDAAGDLFIADTDNNRIREVSTSGIITTVVGNGSNGYGGDGGLATNASLQNPFGVAVDAAGDIFIADSGNNVIRRVDAVTHIITTVAGDNVRNGHFSGDGGPAIDAGLSFPVSVAVDAGGNLFIGDQGNDRVRRVDAVTGIITTVAGDGVFGYSGDGGPATSAELNGVFGIAVDANGDLYIADYNNNRIRKVTFG